MGHQPLASRHRHHPTGHIRAHITPLRTNKLNHREKKTKTSSPNTRHTVHANGHNEDSWNNHITVARKLLYCVDVENNILNHDFDHILSNTPEKIRKKEEKNDRFNRGNRCNSLRGLYDLSRPLPTCHRLNRPRNPLPLRLTVQHRLG